MVPTWAAATVVNLATGACSNLGNPFCVPANTTLSDLAIVTANAGSSSNGQLIVTYGVRETATCGSCDSSGVFVPAPNASGNISDASPPINGASCGPDRFTPAQKACLAGLAICQLTGAPDLECGSTSANEVGAAFWPVQALSRRVDEQEPF